VLIHYTKEPSLHPHQDSNSEQRFWRPLWYHFTMRMFVEIGGLEPPTFDVSDQRSNQLSYTSMCRECQIRTDGLFLPKEARYRTTLIPYDVIPMGLEPMTSSLKVKSSTNWATKSNVESVEIESHSFGFSDQRTHQLYQNSNCACRWTRTTELRRGGIYSPQQLPLCDTGVNCRRYRIRTYDPLDVNQML
jgi:hypothetical protein